MTQNSLDHLVRNPEFAPVCGETTAVCMPAFPQQFWLFVLTKMLGGSLKPRTFTMGQGRVPIPKWTVGDSKTDAMAFPIRRLTRSQARTAEPPNLRFRHYTLVGFPDTGRQYGQSPQLRSRVLPIPDATIFPTRNSRSLYIRWNARIRFAVGWGHFLDPSKHICGLRHSRSSLSSVYAVSKIPIV